MCCAEKDNSSVVSQTVPENKLNLFLDILRQLDAMDKHSTVQVKSTEKH